MGFSEITSLMLHILVLMIKVLLITANIKLLLYGHISWASLMAQLVKNLPAVQETWIQSLNWEDPLEKGMATHSSILAYRIPWTEEPRGLQSMVSQRVRHNLSN